VAIRELSGARLRGHRHHHDGRRGRSAKSHARSYRRPVAQRLRECREAVTDRDQAADKPVVYASTLAASALSWMKARRGSTSSPISLAKISLASSISLTLTWSSERASISRVVSQSCSGFISPRPL